MASQHEGRPVPCDSCKGDVAVIYGECACCAAITLGVAAMPVAPDLPTPYVAPASEVPCQPAT